MSIILILLSFVVPLYNNLVDNSPDSLCYCDSDSVYTVLYTNPECAPQDNFLPDDYLPPSGATVTPTFVEPGDSPEGDYNQNMAWADKEHLWITNYMTKNLSIIDAATDKIVKTVSTGNMHPYGISVNDKYAVVTFPGSNSAGIYDVSGNLLGIVPAGSKPIKTVFSPDGETAYVAGRDLTAINLSEQTATFTVPNFPCDIILSNYNFSSSRRSIDYTDFVVTPDNKYVVAPDYSANKVIFFSTTTGTIFKTISMNKPRSILSSGNGLSAAVLSTGGGIHLHQLNLLTLELTSTVRIPARAVLPIIAVNQDGSKVAISEFYFQGYHAVDFTAGTTTKIATGSQKFVRSNYDHTLAISSTTGALYGYEFETGRIKKLGSTGILTSRGEISPFSNILSCWKPVFRERVVYSRFTNASVLNGPVIVCGSPLEADGCSGVSISQNGQWAVVLNYLSDNASIINMIQMKSVAIVGLGNHIRPRALAITPDSRYALIGAGDNIVIVELATASIIKTIPVGRRPQVVTISRDGATAFILNGGESPVAKPIIPPSISFIDLDGVNSIELARVSCGSKNIYYHRARNYSILPPCLIISPDDSTLLLCNSGGGKANIHEVIMYDIKSHERIATIDMATPYVAAFNADGTLALVTSESDNVVSLMKIDGASSSVIKVVANDTPIQVVYNQTNDTFAVGSHTPAGTITIYDANTCAVKETYCLGGKILEMIGAANGDLITRVKNQRLYRGKEFVKFAGATANFDFCESTNTAVVVLPGPDMLYVVNYNSQDITGDVQRVAPGSCIGVEPNPVSNRASFTFSLPAEQTGNLTIHDMTGRIVTELATGSFNSGTNQIAFNLPSSFPSGIYTVRFTSSEVEILGRFVVVR